MVGVDGLGEKVGGSLLHRRHRVLNAPVGGHHDDRDLRVKLFRGAKDAETVALRQPEVGQHDRWTIRSKRRHGTRLVHRLGHNVILAFEGVTQHRPDRVLVLDDECLRVAIGAGAQQGMILMGWTSDEMD